MSDLFRQTGARFSDCGRYRYELFRAWDPSRPVVTFIMLNPSTADATANDPTVERCERRAHQLGFGRLEVRNLFAWRSTDRAALKSEVDPVGPENDFAIVEAVQRSDLIICAWGTYGDIGGRAEHVKRLLSATGKSVHCLEITRSGHPKHPLYVSYERQPVAWSY